MYNNNDYGYTVKAKVEQKIAIITIRIGLTTYQQRAIVEWNAMCKQPRNGMCY